MAGTWVKAGCVGWMFDRKGYFVIEKAIGRRGKDTGGRAAAGAEDMVEDGSNFELFSSPENFDSR